MYAQKYGAIHQLCSKTINLIITDTYITYIETMESIYMSKSTCKTSVVLSIHVI